MTSVHATGRPLYAVDHGDGRPEETRACIPVRNRADIKVLTLHPDRYRYHDVYRRPDGSLRVKNAVGRYVALADYDPGSMVVPTRALTLPDSA
jgi:hypothetical protein